MQIVIEIPEEEYAAIRYNVLNEREHSYGYVAIANGIPLPNGHGRLIDADALNERMKQRHYENADEESYWIADVIETALNPNNGYAPTIIEADKEVYE